MAVFGRLFACLVLGAIGVSMVVHSPANPGPDTVGVIGIVLVVIGAIGLIEIALGET